VELRVLQKSWPGELTATRTHCTFIASKPETNMTPEQLIIWMKNNKVTTNKLAPLLGMSSETITSYRIGRRPIPVWLPLALESLGRKLNARH
jgi:hypothetical protein